jgi:hypothetical protein
MCTVIWSEGFVAQRKREKERKRERERERERERGERKKERDRSRGIRFGQGFLRQATTVEYIKE